jgi:niacin transporter
MKIKTKELTVISLMTALTIMIPQFMPQLNISPFTATFASHVPIIITMFISPVAALFTAVGSAIGFQLRLGDPFVTARALSHVIFAVGGAYFIKKHYNFVFVLLLAMVVHGVSEAFIAVPIIHTVFPALPVKTTSYIVLFGTFIHHIIDSVISVVILLALSKAKLISYEFTKRNVLSLKG